MQNSKYRIPLVAAAALALVGATPTGHHPSSFPDNPTDTPQSSETTIVVRNHNSLDVEVVAVTEAGKRFRLGSVNRGAARTFELPECVEESNQQFRLKVYSIDRPAAPSIVNHYLDAVKTQLLSSSVGGEIVLQVHSPLSDSFIDRAASGQH